MDSIGEGEGGKIWENGIQTCKISCMKKINKIEKKIYVNVNLKKKKVEVRGRGLVSQME